MNLFHPKFLESSILLKAIFETATDGIITITERGIIQMVNPAAAALFEYEQQELVGKNVNQLMPQPHRKLHHQYVDNYLLTKKKKIIGIGREVEGMKKSGVLFPLRLSVSEINIEGHRIFTGIIHDLSQQRQVQMDIKKLNADLEKRVENRTIEIQKTVEQLLSVNQKLENEVREREKVEQLLRETEKEIRTALEKEKELSELKSRFVTMASHEFRTPLSTILSSTALLEMYEKKKEAPGNDHENTVKHLKRIRSAVGNLTDILNDFLSVSKLEEGKVKSHPETFYMDDFCLEIIDEIQGLLKPGQTIEHQSQNGCGPLFLDKHLLKNILFNLLTNAIKYSPPGKTIYCTHELTSEQLILTVRDEGMGIPEADQAYLFTRFFRASNVSHIQGTGLGLNIVKRYAALMNGVVEFTSQSGVGSTFIIHLPKSAQHEKDFNH